MAEYINKEQLLSHLFSKQDEPLCEDCGCPLYEEG